MAEDKGREGIDYSLLRTPADYIAKFREILHSDGGEGGLRLRRKNAVDWLKLFTDWIHTDVGQYPSIKHFCKANKVHPGSLQHRGGRMFWNQAREKVRAEAMAMAIEKAPELVAAKYEKELKVSTRLVDVVAKYAERLMKDPEPPPPLCEGATAQERKVHEYDVREYKRRMESVPADAIVTLTEAVAKLVETNQKLYGDQRPGSQPAPGVNILTLIVNDLKERNRIHGVTDAEIDGSVG